jgi:hypothetical protein
MLSTSSAIDSKLPGNVACWLRSRKKRSTMFINEALVGVKSANRRPRYSQIDLSSFEVREMIRNRRHNQVFELPVTMHPRGAVKSKPCATITDDGNFETAFRSLNRLPRPLIREIGRRRGISKS